MGTPVVLFRSQGQPAALIDRCPHRNAALSEGKMTGDWIECPYHGWAFDGSGACRRIPGRSEANCESLHQHAQHVSVAERDGLVWVNLNGAAPATLPSDRAADSRGNPRLDRFLWPASAQCSFIDGVENLLDACHPHFAHAGLLRRTQKRRPMHVRIERSLDGVEVTYAENRRAEGVIPRLLEGQRLTSIGRYFPTGIAQLEYRGSAGPQFILTSYFTPCDERTVLIHSVIATPKKMIPAFLKEWVLRRVFGRILHQDQRVLRSQQTNIQRFGGPAFTSTPLDVMRPHILYFISHPDVSSRTPFRSTLMMEL